MEELFHTTKATNMKLVFIIVYKFNYNLSFTISLHLIDIDRLFLVNKRTCYLCPWFYQETIFWSTV